VAAALLTRRFHVRSGLAVALVSTLAAERALPAAEAAHVRLALAPVLERSAALLEDYHANFVHGADAVFLAWAELARDVRAALAVVLVAPSPPAPPFSAAAAICASLAAAYARCRALVAPNGVNSASLPKLAQGAMELADAETQLFTPVLEQAEPAAACVAATQLQALFARDFNAWLPTASSLEEAVPGLKAAEALVAQLQSCAIGGAAGEPPPPIDVAALAEPMAMRWVAARVAQTEQWMERALKLERWAAGTPGAAAASAVDVVRAANESAEAFFALRMQQAAPARALTLGIAATLQAYASTLLRQLGDPARRIPPAPPLTRYKQEAVDLLMQEHARAPAAAAQPQAPAVVPSVDDLMVMFVSLTFLARELPATEHAIQRQWLSLAHVSGGTLRRGQPDLAPLTRLFSDTSNALNDARQQVLAHVGNSIVFQHLRHAFLERAYLFGTKAHAGRLPVTLLEPLNPWMEKVCADLTGEDDRNDAAGAMLAAAVRGVRYVLLEGGPSRIFLQDDCDALEADLAALRDFFVADGDGLTPDAVDAVLVPTSRLLDAMAQDTHQLIALYDRGAAMWDKETLLRVLCHRGDRTSSKYLKLRLKTPKAIGFLEEKRQILATMAHGHARTRGGPD
jgi:hypothetical protein